MTARATALLLAPEAPYPLAGGGALRTASLLHYLARHVRGRSDRLPPARRARSRAQLPFRTLVRRIVVIDLPPNRRSVAARALRNAVRVARAVPPLVDRFSGFAGRLRKRWRAAVTRSESSSISGARPTGGLISTVCETHSSRLCTISSQCCTSVARSPSAPRRHSRTACFGEASLRLERAWLPRFSSVLATSATRRGAGAGHCARGARGGVSQRHPAGAIAPSQRRGMSGNRVFGKYGISSRTVRRCVSSGGRSGPGLRERWPRSGLAAGGEKPGSRAAVYIRRPADRGITGEVEDAVRELARAQVAVVPLLAGQRHAAQNPGSLGRRDCRWFPPRSARKVCRCAMESSLLLADGAAAFAEAVSRLLACSRLRDRVGHGWQVVVGKRVYMGNSLAKVWIFNTARGSLWSAILVQSMRFAVDAHAIGRHLTGNEVYVRSLLNAFAAQDRDCEFVAYVSGGRCRAVHPVPHPNAAASPPIPFCGWAST